MLSLSITEFQASNDLTLEDFDGNSVDWLEVHNSWASSLDLSTWYLTDDPEDLDKWSFPNVEIGASGYLVVYCSGKDVYFRSQIHSNFELDVDGGYLALVAPDGHTIIDEVVYEGQYTDLSYGVNTIGVDRFFAAPTPGKANGMGLTFDDVPPTVDFSREGGAFVEETTLELTTSDSTATILYTTNGSSPKVGSSTTYTYTEPLTLTKTTFVRAAVVRSGEEPGPVVEQTYIGLGADMSSFSSNLPLVAIDTLGGSVNDSYYRRVASAFVDVAEDGRTQLTDAPDFVGVGGIKYRGSSSMNFAKKQYAFETWGMNKDDLDVSLFGLPAESDWVLYAPYSDKSLIRNYLAYKWAEDMGQYAPRTQFFELFLDTDGDGIVTYADYQGVYLLVEKIKQGPDRVDVDKMSLVDTQEPEIAGGYIIKRDRADPGDTGFVTSIENHQLYYVYPNEDEINTQQKAWLSSWFAEFETVLHGADYDDPEIGYAAYIDELSFVDHFILNEGCKNVDGFRLSQYFYLDNDAELIAGPVWDFNLSMGNADYNSGQYTTGWYYPYSTGAGYRYYPTLFRDPNFTQLYVDRLGELRQGILSQEGMWADINEIVDVLQESQQRNFEKWKILGVELWPNYYVGQTYADEINYLKNWLRDRFTWLDNQYLPSPTMSEEEGIMEAPFDLTMTSSRSGTSYDVYYTLDGSDPRVWFERAGGTLLSAGSEWKYLDDGSDQDIAWRFAGFDDSGWKSGVAQFGYGDGDEATVVGYGPSASSKYATTYFRSTFEIDDWADFDGLTLNLLRDDGAIVYINGVEVSRLGVAAYDVEYSTYATEVISGTAESEWESVIIGDPPLITGTNTIAVEIHQCSATSSDISFDLELRQGSEPIGGPSAMAEKFDGTALEFDESTVVTARAYDGSKWSAPVQRIYTTSDPGEVRITEIMYNPSGPLNEKEERFDDKDFEFIELTNTGDAPAWLVDYSLLGGVEFLFSSDGITSKSFLLPGESAVLVSNEEAFRVRYGNDVAIVGVFSGSLSNGGEQLLLLDWGPGLVHNFTYDDTAAWPQRADGLGGSLEIVDSGADYTDPSNWRDSDGWLGSPGIYAQIATRTVVINEVVSNSEAPTTDAIELYNTTGAAVDIGGWWLSDSDNDFFKFSIPEGTVVPPHGYVVFDETDFNPGGEGFALSSIFGDELWLIEADDAGSPARFADFVTFGASADGESFARWPNGSGDLYPTAEITLEDANAAPRVGPVVISEIHYLPAADGFEFVEIHNPTGEAVDLSDWHLGGGIDYLFAPDTEIDPGATRVIVGFDPADAEQLAAFQAYVGGDVVPLGPFSGDLDDAGEELVLMRANERPPESPFTTPYTLEDIVKFEASGAWPTPVAGESLHRAAAELFGNEAAAWIASAQSAGRPFWTAGVSGDLNGDGLVDSGDLDIIRANWGRNDVTPGSLSDGDPSGDGEVGADDLDIVRGNWGAAASAAVERTAAATDAVWERESTSASLRQAAEAAWIEELHARRTEERKTIGASARNDAVRRFFS